MRTRTSLTAAALIAACILLGWLAASGKQAQLNAQDKKADTQPATDRSKLPMTLSPFEGKVGKTYKNSESAWQNADHCEGASEHE